MASGAPCSSRLPGPWNSFFTAILDAPCDPSWLQAAPSQMPTAGHLSALEAPQLALDTQHLLTTPLRPHSYRYVQTSAASPTSTLPSQSEPQSSCPDPGTDFVPSSLFSTQQPRVLWLISLSSAQNSLTAPLPPPRSLLLALATGFNKVRPRYHSPLPPRLSPCSLLWSLYLPLWSWNQGTTKPSPAHSSLHLSTSAWVRTQL